MATNTTRIAKNTLALYFRQILAMLVSLYTVRVVLEILGAEDYGIYTIIFGTVSMLGFLNGTLSTAINRFLTYELAKNDHNRLNDTFGAARTINLILCGIIILIGQTLGLWFLLNRLVIPSDRIYIAIAIYQIAIVIFALRIILIPYSAVILAHERFDIFARFEIIKSVLKLLAVLLLPIIVLDKLLAYGILLLFISVILFTCNITYCMKYFPECKAGLCTKPEYIKPMLTYSGIDLYGNLSIIMRTQGINILLNLFFGPLLNAANGIATHIQGVVGSFSRNLLTAFRPQIIISYASNDKEQMTKYICYAAKYGFLLLFAIILPVYLELPFILAFWLGDVPYFTIEFVRIMLLLVLFANFSSAFASGLHAVGKIKIPSLLNGSIYSSVVPITFFLFRAGFPPTVPFILNVVFLIFGAISNLIALRYHVNEFSIKYFLKVVIMPCIIITFLSSVMPILSVYFILPGFLRFFITTFASLIFIVLFTYFLGLEKEAKDFIQRKISLGLAKCRSQ